MSRQTGLLDGYEAIAHATRGMLDAARAADWASFAQRERDCATWIRRIEQLGNPDALLDAQGRQRRFELLRRMLRDDAEIRDLMQPRLGRAERCIGTTGRAFVNPAAAAETR